MPYARRYDNGHGSRPMGIVLVIFEKRTQIITKFFEDVLLYVRIKIHPELIS